MINILERPITDTYKGTKRINKTVRINKSTALNLDKFLDYCKEVEGRKVSQNQLLTGIINYFIHDYEIEVAENPKQANKKIIDIVNNSLGDDNYGSH